MRGMTGASFRIDRLSAACALFAGLRDAAEEFAGVAYLARDRRMLGIRIVRGDRDRVVLPPRTLAIDALTFGAHGVVVAHNHPSGDPRPSDHDLDHAARVARALATIDVKAKRPVYIGRPESASPATGSARTHLKEQADLVDRALSI